MTISKDVLGCPSSNGLATIHDRDVLICCISQVVATSDTGYPAIETSDR